MPPRRTRTPAASSPLEAVTQLMTERAKYEQWLEELEEKKDATPVNVYDRVQKDYLTRLQRVMEQLKQHTTALAEHASTLVERLRALEAAEQKLQEEQAESELRSRIGEITTKEWQTTSQKADRVLTKLREDQQRVADDLIGIRDILEGDGSAGTAEDRNLPRRSTDFDELAFLKSVVGTPAQSMTPPRPSRAKAAAPKPEPKAETPKAPPKDKGQLLEKGRAAAAEEGPLRTSGAVEQPKTLKCTECGAMNYASEWYCERCGAELTVV